jgi:hypothetical protein
MKKVTGIAVLTTAEGQKVTYTFSEIDESTGTITQSNIKRSFVVLDAETETIINNLKSKVEEHLEAAQ